VLDRKLLVRNVFAVRIAGQPLVVGEQPDIDAEFNKHINAALRCPGRDQMLFDRSQPGVDDRAAVERADRQCNLKRLDQKAHADGRSAGDDGETDTGLVQLANRTLVALRQHLVFG
jgi:hypothetical protein